MWWIRLEGVYVQEIAGLFITWLRRFIQLLLSCFADLGVNWYESGKDHLCNEQDRNWELAERHFRFVLGRLGRGHELRWVKQEFSMLLAVMLSLQPMHRLLLLYWQIASNLQHNSFKNMLISYYLHVYIIYEFKCVGRTKINILMIIIFLRFSLSLLWYIFIYLFILK